MTPNDADEFEFTFNIDNQTYLYQILKRSGPFSYTNEPTLDYSAATLDKIDLYLRGELLDAADFVDDVVDEFIDAMDYLLVIRPETDWPLDFWLALLHEQYWSGKGPMRNVDSFKGLFHPQPDELRDILSKTHTSLVADQFEYFSTSDDPQVREIFSLGGMSAGSSALKAELGEPLAVQNPTFIIPKRKLDKSDRFTLIDYIQRKIGFDRMFIDNDNLLAIVVDRGIRYEILINYPETSDSLVVYNQPTPSQRCIKDINGFHCTATCLWALRNKIDIVTSPDSNLAGIPSGFTIWNINRSEDVARHIGIGRTSLPMMQRTRGKLVKVGGQFEEYENMVVILSSDSPIEATGPISRFL